MPIRFCLALFLMHGFALFAQQYWREEIAVRSQGTKLYHLDYFEFGLKILTRILYGDEASEP